MCRKMMNDVRMVNDYILTVQKFDDYRKDKGEQEVVFVKKKETKIEWSLSQENREMSERRT